MSYRRPTRFSKPIRLDASAYRSGEAFLVTICAARGASPFEREAEARLVAQRLQSHLKVHRGPVVAYCVMPDHVHAILVGAPDVVQWVREFKASVTAAARTAGTKVPLWQRSFHDRCLSRHSEPLDAAVAYVLDNPVRRGLVSRAEDWPYSGIGGV
jgi:putative transposase